MHEIRSRIIAAIAVLPSPILLVFIFWIEQNMMISTRQEAPIMIGLQVAVGIVVVIGMLAFILSWLNRYQLISFHFLLGLFLILSGALLPCLTIKLSMDSAATSSAYTPEPLALSAVIVLMLLVVLFGVYRAKKMRFSQNRLAG